MNPSYFDVNYRGTIGFDPMEKIQQNDKQMTSCLEKSMHFLHFCDMYDKNTNNDKK